MSLAAAAGILREGKCLTAESLRSEHFFATLRAAKIPEEFSVALGHQIVPGFLIAEIARFIRVFNQVVSRAAWRAEALRQAPPIAQARRQEVCFFSAWDFHLQPERGFALIEFNDNGSGFLFAAIINAQYHTVMMGQEDGIARCDTIATFQKRVGQLVEREAEAFFGQRPSGLLLIVDDPESLAEGKFRGELHLLHDLMRERGWQAELARPADLHWNRQRLTFHEEPVEFVVNRSTDFLWRADDFSALRSAYQAGRVYVAPNPFTYATRSDKRLLEWLSSSRWDADLGIEAEERRILSAHVPETHVLRADNVNMLAQRKSEFVFKPAHGYASHGLLDSDRVGRARLRHLLNRSESYVAQRRVSKPFLEVEGVRLWTDLRVWAYRDEIILLSGRASRRPDRLDLSPPGGWIATYVSF